MTPAAGAIWLNCPRVRCADGSPISDQLLESTASKILQLEHENKRLMKQLASLQRDNSTSTSPQTGSKLQHVSNGISKSANANGIDVDDLEAENARLKLDVRKLHAKLYALQSAGDSFPALETKASLLELENKKLMRKVEGFQATAEKVESLERENGRLIAELERAATKTREWSDSAAELELEKDRLERSVEQLEKVVDVARADQVQVNRLEEELTTTRSERDRLQRRLAELSEQPDDVTLGWVHIYP